MTYLRDNGNSPIKGKITIELKATNLAAIKAYVSNGYVAVVNVNSSTGGHFMAIVDYDSSTDKFLVQDSAPNDSVAWRGKLGYKDGTWISAKEINAQIKTEDYSIIGRAGAVKLAISTKISATANASTFATSDYTSGIVPPGEVSGFTVMPTELGFNFSWSLPKNELGYRIYRSKVQGEVGISISDFPINVVNSYFDPNVNIDTTYYYSIAPVLNEAVFDEETVTLTPEVVGERSAQIEAKINLPTPPGPYDEGSEEEKTGDDPNFHKEITNTHGFIMMDMNRPKMNVNGTDTEIDPGRGTVPYNDNGRIVIPIRALVESMGGKVDWVEATQQIGIKALGHTIEMWLNKIELTVDGASGEMDVPVKSTNDRTVVPVRFVAENLGCQIEWIGSLNRVVIVYDKTKAK